MRTFDVRGYYEPRTHPPREAFLSPEERLPGVRLQFRPGAEFRLVYDDRRTARGRAASSVVYRINGVGFRGPDISPERTPGTLRVMMLGDSFTFGEGVADSHLASTRLEAALRAGLKRDVEVMNCGTSAWGTSDEINYLSQTGMRFGPDLVIVVYVLNDADYAGGLDLWNDFRGQYETRALRWSHLASFCYARLARTSLARTYVADTVDRSIADRDRWEASFAELSRGQAIARAGNARFLVAIWPFMFELNDRHPFLPVHEMIAGYCRSHSIPVLDLFPAFKGQDDDRLWVHPSDQHPNAEGHRIAAETLASFILGQGLLNDLPPASGWQPSRPPGPLR